MASTQLDYLLDEADTAQPGLKARIQHELARRTQQFGLVFERHLPETVQLPGRAISTGDTVQILPERGSTAPADPTLWRVVRSHIAIMRCIRHLIYSPSPGCA